MDDDHYLPHAARANYVVRIVIVYVYVRTYTCMYTRPGAGRAGSQLQIN